jgi:pimeloyl-ACP methyl ester carboxylesterase
MKPFSIGQPALRLRQGLTMATMAWALCAPHAAHATKAPPLPQLDWQDCTANPSSAPVQCATARVPLDYDQPNGPTTEIALARFLAADQGNKKGTIFVNPGGPGGSGVELVRLGFGEQLSTAVNKQFDVIGFDPRGVGRSTPVQCWDTEAARDTYLGSQPAVPFAPALERLFYDAYRAIAPLCFGRKQRILDHMSTADVARDLDLLRETVGDKQLSFLGFSYGSYIGSTYANLFPNKVRAVVIDGVLDPRLWSAGLQIVADRKAPLETFKEFIRLCDEAQDRCALWAPGGAAARYDRLRQKLRSNPLVLPNGQTYRYDTLMADTNTSIYAPETWPQYAQLFSLLADAADGQAGKMAPAQAMRDEIERGFAERWPAREPYNNGLDSQLSVVCSDAQFPSFFEAFSAIGGFAERGSFLGPWWWWSNAACAAWPVAKDRYSGPWSTRTAKPVLVVGNYFDGVTDYAGAVNTSRLLSGSRLLSYAGWGHTALGRSRCVTDFTVAYLLDGTLPPEGTVCPANPSPWAPASLARTANAQQDKLPLNGLPMLRPRPR